jgi:hypothetical protein
MDMDTRRGRLLHWLLDARRAIRRKPSEFRWWLADQFSRAALRLRGGNTSVFGFYDGQRGDRAAQLIERLDWVLLLHLDADELRDSEVSETLNELASLAGATWVRHDEPISKGTSAISEGGRP